MSSSRERKNPYKETHDLKTKELFEEMPVPRALAKMALPAVTTQLITLIYNIADTYFIGQTKNPYMVAASSLVLTVFLMLTALSNFFGVGGGTLVVRLIGSGREEEAKKVASLSLTMALAVSVLFSVVGLVFMDPILRFLGASDNTIEYARQYFFFLIVLGGVPTVLSATMSSMVRNIGHSKSAAFGLGMGGILNVVLDPIFMFLILPQGYEVMGAGIATMLSNVAAFIYFIIIYKKLSGETVLALPKGMERIEKASVISLISVGLPASASVLLFDVTNIVINRLASGYGDFQLAAMGIVMKVERLPLNIGIGICMGMTPLIAYNYAAKNEKRMKDFFSAARVAGLAVAFFSVVMYYTCAPYIVRVFIEEPETIRYGTQFLRARCFATPLMFLSFHMVNYMHAVNKGQISLALAVIRQLCLNIPFVLLLNYLFGMTGIIWTQATADFFNVIASYIIYYFVNKNLFSQREGLYAE